jgi:hypothetical protein
MQLIIPSNVTAAFFDDLKPAIEKYSGFLDSSLAILRTEFTMWQQLWLKRHGSH